MKKRCRFNATKLFLYLTLIVIIGFLCFVFNVNYNLIDPKMLSILINIFGGRNKETKFDDKLYQMKLDKQRVNKLLKKLVTFESQFSDIFVKLGVFTSKNVKEGEMFKYEIIRYLDKKSNFDVNDKFINHMKNLSNYYSYLKPSNDTMPPISISVSI